MSATWVTLRCARCGTIVPVPLPPGPAPAWWSCPSCSHPLPVVPLRDPPPLFSWEVFPNVYPPAPPPVPSAERSGRVPVLVCLVVGCLALAALAGLLGAEGALAFSPGPFTVSGEVLGETAGGGTVALSGVIVTVHAEGGLTRTTATDASGLYDIPGIGPGGVVLNLSDPGYFPAAFSLFVSAAYSSSGSGSAPSVIELEPLSLNGSLGTSGPAPAVYSDLEVFVASYWSASVLLGLGLLVGVAGLVALLRRRRPALVVVGGAAAATAPVSVFLLGIDQALPIAGLVAALAVFVGLLALGLQSVRLASEGRVLEPE